MNCKFCGVELSDIDKVCPACGKSIKKDKFPTWVLVVIALVCVGFSTLPIIGITAALTLPTLIKNVDATRSVTALKKMNSTFEQAYLLEAALNDGYYTDADEIWEKTVKQHTNYTDIDRGVKFADGVEVRYTKLKNRCSKVADVSEVGVYTACGELLIDINGFDKKPNKQSQGRSHRKVGDRYTLWMYSDKVESAPNSIEEIVLNHKY